MISTREQDGIVVLSFDVKELGVDVDRDALAAKMRAAIEGRTEPKVIINFENVAYISSGPIGTMIGFTKTVRGMGGNVCLCGVSDYVQETFRAAKLHHLIDIYETEEGAVKAVADLKGLHE